MKLSVRREGKWVRVAVTDNGCGIAAEDLPHIFDRFYKADKAHTSGMGTGLGLSIVKKILEQHGGEITARSGDGETRFEFTLEAGEAPGREKGGDGAAPADYDAPGAPAGALEATPEKAPQGSEK